MEAEGANDEDKLARLTALTEIERIKVPAAARPASNDRQTASVPACRALWGRSAARLLCAHVQPSPRSCALAVWKHGKRRGEHTRRERVSTLCSGCRCCSPHHAGDAAAQADQRCQPRPHALEQGPPAQPWCVPPCAGSCFFLSGRPRAARGCRTTVPPSLRAWHARKQGRWNREVGVWGLGSRHHSKVAMHCCALLCLLCRDDCQDPGQHHKGHGQA